VRSLKTTFALVPSNLSECIAKVHKLDIPRAVSQEHNGYTDFGRGLCGRRRNGYL